MSKENNKIYFTNSPFTNGHKVNDFVWSARLDEQLNLWMDLHLESDHYDQEEEYKDDLEEIDDVSEENVEKALWVNYGHCVLSSTYWENKGIPIDSKAFPLNFEELNSKTLLIDELPIDLEKQADLAFGISMLGNDTPANHEITFLDTEEFGVFDIKWKGKVANTYADEKTFDYDFYVYMKNIKFAGVKVHPEVSKVKAEEFFQKNFVHNDEFELIEEEELSLSNYVLRLKQKI